MSWMEELNLPPELKIYYVKDPAKCVEYLNKILYMINTQWSVWAFDMEWTVNYTSQQPVSLIQLCHENTIFLFHVKFCGFPSQLSKLLQHSRIFKLGVNIMGDIQKLERDIPSFEYRSARGIIDLKSLSVKLGFPSPTSLSNLCIHYLKKKLPKPYNIRVSNWDQTLSTEHINYAALDVYSTYQIYMNMMKKGVDKKYRQFICMTSTISNASSSSVENNENENENDNNNDIVRSAHNSSNQGIYISKRMKLIDQKSISTYDDKDIHDINDTTTSTQIHVSTTINSQNSKKQSNMNTVRDTSSSNVCVLSDSIERIEEDCMTVTPKCLTSSSTSSSLLPTNFSWNDDDTLQALISVSMYEDIPKT